MSHDRKRQAETESQTLRKKDETDSETESERSKTQKKIGRVLPYRFFAARVQIALHYVFARSEFVSKHQALSTSFSKPYFHFL